MTNIKNTYQAPLFVIAAMLAMAFPAILLRDYALIYQFGSAPFYTYIGLRFIELLLPAGLLYLIGNKMK